MTDRNNKPGIDKSARGLMSQVKEALRASSDDADEASRRAPVTTTPGVRHFIKGLRPVKLITLPDGGLDVQAFDWATHAFTRDLSLLADLMVGHDAETREVSPADFATAVEAARLVPRAR